MIYFQYLSTKTTDIGHRQIKFIKEFQLSPHIQINKKIIIQIHIE